MIKIKTLEVAGIGPAIHAMRNPYDSWEKSDTHHGLIGEADKALGVGCEGLGRRPDGSLPCPHLGLGDKG